MRNCPFCNSPMEDGAKFCTNCGQKVEVAVSPAESAPGMTYGNEQAAPAPAPAPTPAPAPITTPAPAPTPMSAPTGPAGSAPGMAYDNQQTGGYTQQQAGQTVGGAAYVNQQASQNGFNGQQAGPNAYGGQQAGPNGYGGQQTGPNTYGGQQGMRGGYNPAMGGVQHPGMAQPAKKNLWPLFIIGGVALVAVIAIIVLFATGVFGGKKGGSANDPNLGDYKAVALEMMGMVLDPKEFSQDEMTITLNAGGKAVILTGSDKSSGTWTLDGEKFTLKGGGLDATGTLKDGVMKLPDLGGMGADWTFSKDGKTVPGLNTTSVGDDGLLGGLVDPDSGETDNSSTGNGDTASSTIPATGGNFTSPTKEITWPSDWYGWVKISDITGDLATEFGNDMFIDAFAIFDKMDGGRAYFEVYETPDYASEGDSPLITFYVKENPSVLEPDGTEDAYLLDMPLTDWDLFDVQTSMYSGKINFVVEYETDHSSATFEFFIREYEAPWDESGDTLPPGYDTYCK